MTDSKNPLQDKAMNPPSSVITCILQDQHIPIRISQEQPIKEFSAVEKQMMATDISESLQKLYKLCEDSRK